MASSPSCERPVPTDLLADVLWQRLDRPSFEHCRVQRAADFIAINGCVLTASEGTPLRVDYVVVCAPDWATRQVNVVTTHDAERRRMELRHDESGVWWRDGDVLEEFEGLIDVDLAITPSTNTLPIRRLSPSLGADLATDAVWVQFPSLSIERLPQTYTRTGERQYLYQSRGGEFTAELEVDAEGLVVRYGSIWERVAP